MHDTHAFPLSRKARAVPKSDLFRACAIAPGTPPGSFGALDRLNRGPGRAPAQEGHPASAEGERTPHGIEVATETAALNCDSGIGAESSQESGADLIGSCALIVLFLLLALFGDVGAL